MVGDDYIYVGTVLGIRGCRDSRKNDFPEENGEVPESSQNNRLVRFYLQEEIEKKNRDT